MPELPDVTVYVEALERHVVGRRLEGVRLASASLLRSVEPPLAEAAGRRAVGASRLGKRIVLSLEGELYLVLHLMIAGACAGRGRGRPFPRSAPTRPSTSSTGRCS